MSGDAALLELLRLLKDRHYQFTTVTPATHARVVARSCARPDLRDIFGWNREFGDADLQREILRCLTLADMVERNGHKLRSKVRVASLGDELFLHSAYPTSAADAVFFGPDTYRFVSFVREQLPHMRPEPRWIVDMGTGSGAGAIVASQLLPHARVTAIDINPAALRFAAMNADAAGTGIETVLSTDLPNGADLVIANPPYIMDAERRTYRDGGDLYGGRLALEWVEQALRVLPTGGAMMLYTGASIVNGRAPLVEALRTACAEAGTQLDVEETDPDVFGEELDSVAYDEIERISLICATIRRL